MGTIAPQLPFFRARIAHFDNWLGGAALAATINLAFAETRVTPGTPDHAIGPVRWTSVFPPERFLLSRATIGHDGRHYPVWLYIPDPATKPDHFQPTHSVELLARTIPLLACGDHLSFEYREETLLIVDL